MSSILSLQITCHPAGYITNKWKKGRGFDLEACMVIANIVHYLRTIGVSRA
jgi:ribosomal protein L13E